MRIYLLTIKVLISISLSATVSSAQEEVAGDSAPGLDTSFYTGSLIPQSREAPFGDEVVSDDIFEGARRHISKSENHYGTTYHDNIFDCDGKLIATFSYSINGKRGVVDTGLAAVAPEYKGQGFASDLLYPQMYQFAADNDIDPDELRVKVTLAHDNAAALQVNKNAVRAMYPDLSDVEVHLVAAGITPDGKSHGQMGLEPSIDDGGINSFIYSTRPLPARLSRILQQMRAMPRAAIAAMAASYTPPPPAQRLDITPQRLRPAANTQPSCQTCNGSKPAGSAAMPPSQGFRSSMLLPFVGPLTDAIVGAGNTLGVSPYILNPVAYGGSALGLSYELYAGSTAAAAGIGFTEWLGMAATAAAPAAVLAGGAYMALDEDSINLQRNSAETGIKINEELRQNGSWLTVPTYFGSAP